MKPSKFCCNPDVSGFDRQTAVSNYLEHLEMFNNRAVAFFLGCACPILNLPNVFLGVPYFKASKIVAVSCLTTQEVAPKTKKWYPLLACKKTAYYFNILGERYAMHHLLVIPLISLLAALSSLFVVTL
jgi:hypothetical protein